MDPATAQLIMLFAPTLIDKVIDAIEYATANDIDVPTKAETLAAIDRLQAMEPLSEYRGRGEEPR